MTSFRVTGLALAACACVEPQQSTMQAQSSGRAGYHVFKLNSLGTTSNGNGITNLGWITGVSTAADGATRATAWAFGFPIDLGSLGGNSAVIWPVKNTRGIISGIAEVPGDDPRNEAWSCAAFMPKTPGHVCRGFVWEDGELRALPTLGGTHGF